MDEVLRQLSSPVFWICVVVTGLLINFISAYSKPLLDLAIKGLMKAGSSLGKAMSERLDERRRRVDRAVDYLLKNPTELTDLKLDQVGRLLGLVLLCLAAVLATLGVEFVRGLPFQQADYDFRHVALPPLLLEAILRAQNQLVAVQLSVYFCVALAMAAGARRYLVVRRFLRAYRHAAHTAVSRLLTDHYAPN